MHASRSCLRRLGSVAALLVIGLSGCSGKPERSAPATPPATPAPSVPATATTTAGPATPGSPTAAPSLQGRAASLSLPAARYRTAGAAIGGDLYVLGGLDAAGAPSADVYRVQPATSKVALAGHLRIPTAGGAAVAFGGKVLVFGGSTGTGNGALDLVQAFDPATGTTAQAGTLPHPRTEAAAVQVGNEIIILGGTDGTAAVPDILATADGSTFHAVGKLALPVWAPAAVVVGTTVYVFGGVIANPAKTGGSVVVQSYSISSGLSKTVGMLRLPLAYASAVAYGNQVYVLGGSLPDGPTDAIQRFDPSSGALLPAGKLPGPLADAAAAIIGNTAYLAGGIAARPLTSIVAVTPSR